ncbi:hypothetical protein F53441_14736 [Fusarium austroafricanum]|uniref:Uncharacterized protein n=1 Tax=Fusarium austroafricanum TaxID=2364996 RepID=A0A8H4J7E8_9HYPO|nr:hypothetical protein F53441_14736 [Fusarium austroafricanum]
MSIETSFDLQCTLVCCLLFVAFEGITGRYAESIRHIRAGTKLLSSPVLVNNPKEQRIAEKLLVMFSSLGVEASAFMEDTITPDIRPGYFSITSGTDAADQPFRDLDEAASALRKMDVEMVELISEMPSEDTSSSWGSPGSSFGNSDVFTNANLEASWNELNRKFQVWSSRFELTKKHISTWEYQELLSPQLLYLTLQQQFWRMDMTHGLEDDSEPSHETVEDFLNAAETFAQRLITPGQPSFSLDGDLISGLSFVISFCSEEHHRMRALNLLRSLNRREGIWDSQDIAELHEATLALENAEAWYLREIPGGVPGYVAELAKISSRVGLHRSRLLINYDTDESMYPSS